MDSTSILNDVETYLSRFVVYPSDHARIAHVLWIGHTWFMDLWDSTPRLAFLSPEPGSGKSRALEVTEHLVPRPIHAVNVSSNYLFRKVSDEAGAPTILFDEIDTVFGSRAKENEDLRGMINAGHRKGAVAGRCEVRGKEIGFVEFPAYCPIALAGLNDLPDTIMTRSVVIRMRRRSSDETVEPWRLRLCRSEASALGERLHQWSIESHDNLGRVWPEMPEGIEDRNADVWEPLIAIADHAGGEWPQRSRMAAQALVAGQVDDLSIGLMLLRDIHKVFSEQKTNRLATTDLLIALNALDESPWGDIRGRELDPRGLSRRLSKYGIKPKPLRISSTVVKGYESADFNDAWNRYLPPPQDLPVTELHPSPERVTNSSEVTDVTTNFDYKDSLL